MKSKTHPTLHLLTLCLFTASQAHADELTWADSVGNTAFFNGASWVGGVAPANSTTSDTAVFTSVANAQPVLSAQSRIAGIDFQMAAGGLALSGANQLFQIGTTGINATGQTSGTNTFGNARISLFSGNQTWNFFSDVDTASTSTFTFDSTVDLGSRNLTVIGQRNAAVGNVGIINFERAISGQAGVNLTINSSNTNNTVNLKGVNTYLGVTNVNGGIVNVQNNQSTATGGWNIQTPNTAGKLATVNFIAGSEIAVTDTAKIQIGAAANSGSHPASTLNVVGTVDNDGALQMERASNLNLNNGAVWDQAGNLTLTARGGASATLNVNAGAEMTYTGSNTFKLNTGTSGSGLFNINGTGRFTTAAGFQNTTTATTGSGVSRITLAGGGTLRLSANVANLTNQTLFTLGTGGGMIDNGGFDATLNGAVTAGSLTTATGITGTGGLTSIGSGTLTLSGINTYTGNTLVSAGTLLVTGALAADSNVTIAANAAFGGTGTVSGNLSFDQDSIFQITHLNTPLTVGGTVSFGTGFGIANLLGMDWGTLTLNTPYTLITTDQIFTASDISNFGIGNAADVGAGRQAYFQTGSLQVVVIPEPGSALLGGVGILMLLRRRRY
jgi:autotransporter-associated beta strand protein